MTDPYRINPKIPQDPDRIWAVAKKLLPGRERDEFLIRPRYVYSGKNIRIAYPGFLTWLKFVDPDRQGEDLGRKVIAYDRAKSRYELQMTQLLKEFREGKDGRKFAAPAIIIDQVDQPGGMLITFQPSRWNKLTDAATMPQDAAAGRGKINQGFLVAGTPSLIWISPEALTDTDSTGFMTPDMVMLHEIVHAVFMMHGNDTNEKVNRGWRFDNEFFAIAVENVFRSEKGIRQMRASHAASGAFIDDDENLLDMVKIQPPPRMLFARFARLEPEVFRRLALIPRSKARFNPFRDYKEEQDKRGPTDE
jgi:hypothetical protein